VADHQDHDPELIVALLDRDVPDADRAAAQALVASCRPCAELHADLVSLALATAAVPLPPRPRDFTLTRAMAAALAPEAAREPVRAGPRLSREMPDSRSRHAAHDRLLIANLIDRAVDEGERARAEELLAACSDCERLYDDLVALSAATRAMSLPARPRDFTLTAADAERLRVRGWRKLLGAIGTSRDVFSRPLALGLTTLGLAGLIVATIPSVLMGGAASGPELSTVGNAIGDAAGGAPANPEMAIQAPGAPAASAESGPAAAAPAPSAAPEAPPQASGDTGTERIEDDPDQLFFGSETSPLPGEPEGRDLAAVNQSAEGPFTRSTTIVVAGVLLVVGLLLFGLRWTARRLGDG
jgi:hypothetical protein